MDQGETSAGHQLRNNKRATIAQHVRSAQMLRTKSMDRISAVIYCVEYVSITADKPHPYRTMKRFKPYLPPLLSAVLLYSGIIWALQQERQYILQDTLDEAHATAQAVAQTFLSMFDADMPYPGMVPARLQSILRRIVKTTAIQYISLQNNSRPTPLAQVGIPPHHPSSRFTPFGHSITNKHLLWWKSIELTRPGPNSDDTDHLLIMAIDLGGYWARERVEINRLFLNAAIAAFAGLLLLSYWIYTIYTRRMNLQLAIANQRSEQMQDLALAAAGLAHETKNPLGRIRGLAQCIIKCLPQPHTAHDMAADIIDEVDITTARLGDFLRYAAISRPDMRPVHLRDVTDRLQRLLEADCEAADVQFTVDAPDCTIRTDPELLSQVLINLLINSIQACTGGKKVILSGELDRKELIIRIQDNGSGIAPELLPRIFKPYVTGRDDGHGIGLALVHRMLEDMDCQIQVRSTPDIQTLFTLTGFQRCNLETRHADSCN